VIVAVELPEKQGLKHKSSCCFRFTYTVAVELPEKQGLKLQNAVVNFLSQVVAVELPEKQGLKQPISNISSVLCNLLQWNFQKNKD